MLRLDSKLFDQGINQRPKLKLAFLLVTSKNLIGFLVFAPETIHQSFVNQHNISILELSSGLH